MSTDGDKKLASVVAEIYERRCHEVSVSPSWLATEAMTVIDPERLAPELAYLAAHLALRQIARAYCRGRFAGEEDEKAQHELFPDLQQRYPTERSFGSKDPQYIRLEHIPDDDIAYNVSRLRKEGVSKLRHADALEAYGASRPRVEAA